MFDTREAIGSGFEVSVASNTLEPMSGNMAGAEVEPDLFIENVVPGDYDGMVIIGGGGMSDVLYEDKGKETTNQMISQIKAFNSAKKLVAAICIAPIALARAGALKGKKFTIWDDGKRTQISEGEQSGGVYAGGPVVVDGNIITADGPRSAKKFGEAIKNYFGAAESKNPVSGVGRQVSGGVKNGRK